MRTLCVLHPFGQYIQNYFTKGEYTYVFVSKHQVSMVCFLRACFVNRRPDKLDIWCLKIIQMY